MLPKFLCRLGLFILRVWGFIEKLILILFSAPTKAKISLFCKLNSSNKGVIVVNDDIFFRHVAQHGLTGFPKALANKWISVQDLDLAMQNIMKDKSSREALSFRYKSYLDYLRHDVFFHPNLVQKPQYYEFDSALFRSLLGPTMIHSSGRFLQETDDLETGQANKLNEMAQLLELQQGSKVLDIGCGWGGAAKYLAENFGVSVSAITSSPTGYNSVQQMCMNLPVTVYLSDCSQERFPVESEMDAVYALMVMMYVKAEDRRAFFQKIASSLKQGGLLYLQLTMTSDPSIPIASGIVNSFVSGCYTVYQDEFLKASEGIFRLKLMNCVSKDAVRTEQTWLKRLKENREVWVKGLGEEVTYAVEMFHICMKNVHEFNDVQVFNVLLQKI